MPFNNFKQFSNKLESSYRSKTIKTITDIQIMEFRKVNFNIPVDQYSKFSEND